MLFCKSWERTKHTRNAVFAGNRRISKAQSEYTGELSGEGYKRGGRLHPGRDRPQHGVLLETSDQAQGNHPFDLDDAKARPLVLAAGYRYLSAPGKPSTNRIPIAATSHLPIKAELLLTDRNRADLDWSGGTFTWRYRNMLSLERTLAIHSYHLIPYASAEFYYESQYSKCQYDRTLCGLTLPHGKTLSA